MQVDNEICWLLYQVLNNFEISYDFHVNINSLVQIEISFLFRK